MIIILGILAVTAAPKFINLKSDAHRAVLQGLKASISSANTLVYSKALLQGKEREVVANVDLGASIGRALLAYGYIPSSLAYLPQDTKASSDFDSELFDSITTILAIDAEMLTSSTQFTEKEWGLKFGGSDMYVNFIPRGLSVSSSCYLQYSGLNSGSADGQIFITIIDDGC